MPFESTEEAPTCTLVLGYGLCGGEYAHQVKAPLAAAFRSAHGPSGLLCNQKGGSSPHITDERTPMLKSYKLNIIK